MADFDNISDVGSEDGSIISDEEEIKSNGGFKLKNKMKKQKSIANKQINETVENVKGVRKVTREQGGVSMTTYE